MNFVRYLRGFLILELMATALPLCKNGYFSINGMDCHPLITCNEISKLTLGALIGFGAVKKVYKSKWKKFDVAVVAVNNPEFSEDFHHGLNLMIHLSPSKYLTTLIGHCKTSNVYVTEYYPRGNALAFENFLPPEAKENMKSRMRLCLSYIKIIDFFHTTFDTPAVMCDTSALNKTLQQYLITNSLSLVANDIDSLAVVGVNGIVCGKKELRGDFIAPEQRWSNTAMYFNHTLLPKYDEKTDIWKVPPVCKHFLGKSREAKILNYHLHQINKLCLSESPSQRPNSKELLKAYEVTFKAFIELENKEEL